MVVNQHSDKLGKVCWAAFLLAAAYLLFLPPETVMAIAVPPDSSEYSIGLVNLFEHGRFGFALNGEWYPSRYAPWFSLFCLSPAYLLSGGNALCFNWSILAFAIALLWLFVAWGRRVALGNWTVAAVMLPLLLPDFVFFSRVVMTEIPYTALFAGSALLFLRLFYRRNDATMLFCFAVGVVIAWGGAVRATMLPMVLPFAIVIAFFSIRPIVWRSLRLIVMGLPLAVFEIANLVYNCSVFGSVFRNGYNYWLPIPHDFPGLVFNLGYVLPNVLELLACPVIKITVLMLAVILVVSLSILAGKFGGVRENGVFLLLSGFLFFQAAVLMALYLGYYWPDTRFFLVLTLCSVPLSLAAIHLVVFTSPKLSSFGIMASSVLVCALAFLASPVRYYGIVAERQMCLGMAKVSASVLPADSVVMQLGDPNVLEHFCFAEKGIRLLPFKRIFDYEQHMVAPKSIDGLIARPEDWRPHFIPELIEKGVCKLPFECSFEENAGIVTELLNQGKRVFLESKAIQTDQDNELLQRELKRLGLSCRQYGEWALPGSEPNSIRHIYDALVFGKETRDSCPEVRCLLYEIVKDGNLQ